MPKIIEAESPNWLQSKVIPFREVEKAYRNFPIGAYYTLLRNGYAISPEHARRYPLACFPDFVESVDVDRHLKHIASHFSKAEGGWRNGFEKKQIERVREKLGIPGDLPSPQSFR